MRVLHIADVHIRTGVAGRARRADYLAVIDRLVALARSLAPPMMTVIAGDVLHDRTALDPHAVHVFRALMVGLAQAGPVVVIQGNHDHHPLHDCPDAPHDVLGELLRLASVPGVTYLDRSGHSVVNSVGFGVVTVHDSMPEGESRSGTAAPATAFPCHDPAARWNVALFHGQLQGSKGDGGSERSGVPPAWFAGYDAVMLGDQHVQQIGNHRAPAPPSTDILMSDDPNAPTWAFPGSLVQQSHGESLWNHGAIVWDLDARTLRPVHLACPRGFVTLRDDCIQYDGAWQKVALHVADPDFPRTVEARTRGDADAAIAVLEAAGISVSRARRALAEPGTADEPSAAPRLVTDWRECVAEKIDVSASVAASVLPSFGEPSLAAIAAARNGRLEKLARDAGAGGPLSKAKLRPRCLTWSGLLCYGDGNAVSFFADSGVVLVSGGNGAGKTSFLEVFLLALFGEGFPSRARGDSSAAIINVEREAAGADIEFELDGVGYRVSRKWARSPKDRSRALCRAAEVLAVAAGDAPAKVLCKGRAAVDEWVAQHVCTATDFLSGPMLSQSGDCDVLALSGRDMAALLERAYGLAGIDALGDLLTEATNAHKQVVARADALLHGVTRDDFDRARAEYKAARSAAKELKARMDAMPNPSAPKRKSLAAARETLDRLGVVQAEYDAWEHNKDAQALTAARALVLPGQGDLPCEQSEPTDARALDFATVATLWARYSDVAAATRRHGFQHSELLARPELQGCATAGLEVDYGAEMDRLSRAIARARTREKDAVELLRVAVAELDAARAANRDAVGADMADVFDECASAWPALPVERMRSVVRYIASAGSDHLPHQDVLCDALAVSEEVVGCDSFEGAMAAMGVARPCCGRAVKVGVRDCAEAVAAAERGVARERETVEELRAEYADAEKALKDQVLSRPDEAAVEAMRALDKAWSPLKDASFVDAVAARDAEIARLEAAVAAHVDARDATAARAVLEADDVATARERLRVELDALDLEAKAVEWGRVSQCDAVLKDSAAIDACRDRLATVSQAAARLKGVKNWLYSERIAPEVAGKVNAVVSRVSPGLSVSCVVSDDGGVGWSVLDAGRRVSPQRASGFQRFMISVALRVVFGGMLAPCSVAFIDEGFTACDQLHLSRVPEFLEYLVTSGHADTVVLVSHLAEIREHVPRVVDLRAGAPFVA